MRSPPRTLARNASSLEPSCYERCVTLPSVLVGIDENGLGSRLGPMLVTAVRLSVQNPDLAEGPALQKLCARVGIGDSKALCAHGSMAEVESLVLALGEVHLGVKQGSLEELLGALCLESDAQQRALCPEGEAPRVCFGSKIPLPAFGGEATAEARARAQRLLDAGVRVDKVLSLPVCAKRINQGKARGQSRFDLDLDAMLRLSRALVKAPEAPRARVACGKVGGRKSYLSALSSHFTLARVEKEEKGWSSYVVPGLGQVCFVMDGDATEPAISLGSLWGKYLRELLMERHNRYWSAVAPECVPVSGYHDPRTAKLVDATALVRKERGIAAECFER